MKYSFHAVLFAAIVLLAACTVGPFRAFKATVPPPLTKTAEQVEAERRAADLIFRFILTPVELKPVARALSTSLGAPETPIPASTPLELPKAAAQSTTELMSAIVVMQKKLDDLNVRLIKYQGKDIEGTGFSLLGPGTVTIIIVLIALACVSTPAAAVMAFMFRRMKAVAGIVVNQMEEAAEAPETKEAIAVVKRKVSKAMGDHAMSTRALKNVILDLKKA